MIEILKTAPAISAKRAEKLLKDGIVWIETFRRDTAFKKQILDWVRYDQLRDEGVDEDGEVIGFYSYLTEVISGGRKQQGTPYTLEDTGAFYRSMFISVAADSFTIDGDTTKMEDQAWWSDGILGLTELDMQKLIDEYRARLIDYAKRILLDNL